MYQNVAKFTTLPALDIKCTLHSSLKVVASKSICGNTTKCLNSFLFSRNIAHNAPLFQCRPYQVTKKSSFFESNRLFSSENIFRNSLHKQHSSSILLPVKRNYSDDRNIPHVSLPRLMDFPQIAWPSLFKAIRNWVLANFIITPYFDKDFNIQDFLFGSKQAVEFVSQHLARGEYDQLIGIVSPTALREIQRSISQFSVQQRADLAVSKEDIYFSFPYQVGIMFNENQKDDQQQQRFVEITVCYHVLRGLQEIQAQSGKVPLNIGSATEFQDKVFILNYRFIREFTKGVTADWTVNVVNHYRPSDYV